MTNKITNELAIDIVLFLPPDSVEEMVALSNYLNDKYGEKNRLNTRDRFPHISLLMGVIQENDIEKVGKILNNLAKEFLPIELLMTELKSKISSSAIEVERTAKLVKLQKSLLDQVSPLITNNPTAEMFYEEPTEKNIEWVKNFSQNCTGDNFHAHITVGPVFENEPYNKLHNFSSITIALCQLGLHCTCRKLLIASSSL